MPREDQSFFGAGAKGFFAWCCTLGAIVAVLCSLDPIMDYFNGVPRCQAGQRVVHVWTAPGSFHLECKFVDPATVIRVERGPDGELRRVKD
jgi:hypothetical protein